MSSKSKRIVSVFDRLGPGADESSSGSGRRYSSDKVVEKTSRHSFPLTSPEQMASREKKTSHSDYDDKKHVYHREGHKVGSKRSRHVGSSSESFGSDSEAEPSKRRKKEGDTMKRPKHSDSEKKRHLDRKDSSTVLEGKGRSHPHDHKRRREDDYYADKKHSKHESDSYEYKKPRLSEYSSPRDARPRDAADHKRRYESPRDVPSRSRHTRSHSPTDSALGSRKPDRSPGKSDKKPTSKKSEENEGVTETPKALDWDYLSSYTLRQTAKLDQSRPKSVLEQFTPGALFSRVGVSLSLAGSEYYSSISAAVSAHLSQAHTPEDITQDPFGSSELGAISLAKIKKEKVWKSLFKTGDCRRAFTASDDISLRRKLRKHNQSDFLPRLEASSWESQQYSTGVALFRDLGKKSSGKPAYKTQESLVGELIVAR